MDFINFNPTKEKVRKLEKSELLLDAHPLGVESESEIASPLQNLICIKFLGTKPNDSLMPRSLSQTSIN